MEHQIMPPPFQHRHKEILDCVTIPGIVSIHMKNINTSYITILRRFFLVNCRKDVNTYAQLY